MKNLKYMLFVPILFIGLLSSAQSKKKTITFQVEGSCGMCKEKIENSLDVAGVKKANWDISTHVCTVTFNPQKISEVQIHENIANKGYRTEKKAESKEAYANLPGCCQYDGEPEPQSKSDEEDSDHQDEVEEEQEEHDEMVKGIVVEQIGDDLNPVPGADIQWLGTDIKTVTDNEGKFEIKHDHSAHQLVISALTFDGDTIEYEDEEFLSIVLNDGEVLDGVEVLFDASGMRLNLMDPLNAHLIDQGELRKAACCNLAESFETNPSVDASFTDAVTGTKQIQMLGLAGKYVQIMQDNIPMVRGLSTIYGLEYVPGSWINSIQVSKGVGSVVNGYESITGQINLDWKKPGNSEKLLVNGYANQGGRAELNVNYDQVVGKRWETTLLLHGKINTIKRDNNNDGFLDNPLVQNFNIHNQWNYVSPNWHIELGAGFLQMNTVSGQSEFNTKEDLIGKIYGVQINNQRAQGFAKIGYLYPNEDYKSLAIQLSGSRDDNSTSFDALNYNGTQESFKANVIFQDEIGSGEKHRFRTGMSFLYDNFKEDFQSQNFWREEVVPGVYYEHNWSPTHKWGFNGGLRADYHNLYGVFVSPRLHARYSLTERASFKASAGKGQRTPNVFAENLGYFASSRTWVLNSDASIGGYGLLPEIAWNFGLNFTQKFEIGGREGDFTVDAYRTDFQNQVIVDLENPMEVAFYNLNGASTSNSIQAELNYEVFKGFEARVAYRFLDVKTDYASGELEVPFVSKHRAFVNFGYETEENDKEGNWKFDLTTQWIGQKRLPNTASKLPAYQLEDYSSNYFLMNAQVTWVHSKRFEFYVGGENLTNYRQANPILSSDDPFSDQFDASIVWAPIFGRMIYVGFRVSIP